MTVNQVAFGTVVSLSVLSGGCILAAATTASSVAAVAYITLGIIGTAVATAGVTAWLGSKPGDSYKDYFEKMKDHSAVAVASAFHVVAHVLVQAALQAIAEVVVEGIKKALCGDRRYA